MLNPAKDCTAPLSSMAPQSKVLGWSLVDSLAEASVVGVSDTVQAPPLLPQECTHKHYLIKCLYDDFTNRH